MKKLILALPILLFVFMACDRVSDNKSAMDEQAHVEKNQQGLNKVQPSPTIQWSMERDNLIKRFKMMNDRGIFFYMYIFIEGFADPVGYYQVNKVSSVNSQLTATQQVIQPFPTRHDGYVIESPAEDGSYGSNGNGVFGFTPDDIYIEHNMKYIVSTVPLSFTKPVNKLTVISVETENQLKTLMDKIKN
jgi:hypothetical protein